MKDGEILTVDEDLVTDKALGAAENLAECIGLDKSM